MKRLSLLLIAVLILGIFTPIAPYIKSEKTYSYTEDIVAITPEKSDRFDRTASLSPVISAKNGYIYTGNLPISTERNSFTLGIRLSPTEFSDEESIRVIWKSGDQTEVRSLDLGNGRDGQVETMVFTEPAVFPLTKSVSYTIVSDRSLDGKISASALDVSSYTTHLAIGTETASAAVGGDTRIISRKDWGADESIRYQDSATWKSYYAKLEATKNDPVSEKTLAYEEKLAKIDAYLKEKFSEQSTIAETIKQESGHPLVWPIERTKSVGKIVVHHTAENNLKNLSNEQLLRSIYYYHTATRGWGDIGYNYIIGQRGEIYEGRAGGDYVVGAHASWNNRSTVGVSVIGNFEVDNLNTDQESGIKSAIRYLANKYGIDLSKQSYGHRECLASKGCLMEDIQGSNIVGHRDVGYTTCPGANLYAILPDFRKEATYSFGLTTKINPAYAASNSNSTTNTATGKTTQWPMVRVLLSYEGRDSVEITGYTKAPRIQAGVLKWTLSKNTPVTVKVKGSELTVVIGKKEYRAGKEASFSGDVLKVSSWDRKPTWDTTGKLNDNLFRGTLRVRVANGKIELVNILPLEQYLYGIAEISNGDPVEKMKTILISARSYAYFYTNPSNRKFPGKDYDGSDNPDVFQKYLGYGYELRSPNTVKYVNETKGVMITYKGKVIKPWYFSSSNGRVKSYKEYCEANKKKNSSVVCEDIPYLQGGPDPGGAGHALAGHGVGLSGIGATYFANNLEWDYSQILAYYYNGTDTDTIY